MAKEKTYYSIRTVKAKTESEAVEKVINGEFDGGHNLCDAILSTEELIKLLLLELEN